MSACESVKADSEKLFVSEKRLRCLVAKYTKSHLLSEKYLF